MTFPSEKLAVIADIHGNALALEAVLADIARRGVGRIVNLGDIVSGPLWPRETMEILDGVTAPTVRGNHDRWASGDDASAMGPSDRFAFEKLDAEQRERLGALPATIDLGRGVVAFHACPDDDNRYLIERIQGGELVRDRPYDIARRLGTAEAQVVLRGHSHIPGMIRLPSGILAVNPGSVGCPAYDDPDGRYPHVSESGSPHARYAVLTPSEAGPSVEFVAIAYDWEAAARQAQRNGRPEWAHALRRGFMLAP